MSSLNSFLNLFLLSTMENEILIPPSSGNGFLIKNKEAEENKSVDENSPPNRRRVCCLLKTVIFAFDEELFQLCCQLVYF